MADGTHISWSDATWNPITGCSVVSAGCTNCYAMRLAGTRLRHHASREGLTKLVNGNHVWTSEVRFNEAWLPQPIRWTAPRRIFVCAHGDLFHANVHFGWIDQVFAVMAIAEQHTFQVLTKRPEIMLHYMTDPSTPERIQESMHGMRSYRPQLDLKGRWPLPNVWMGTSVEDQPRAEYRIPILRVTPAAVRFLSVEPMLGHVQPWTALIEARTLGLSSGVHHTDIAPDLDWVICGGESGPKARDMDPEWARDLKGDCFSRGVAFHMKQMAKGTPIPDDLMVREFPA